VDTFSEPEEHDPEVIDVISLEPIASTLLEVSTTTSDPIASRAEVLSSTSEPDVITTSEPIPIPSAQVITEVPNQSNNTTAYGIGGAAAVAAAAAAGVFFFKRRASAIANVAPDFSTNNNMNPLYEGMEQFDNPLYDSNTSDA